MAHIPELMAAGVPARLARMLGSNRLRTVFAQGSSQDDAAPLFTNFCLVACDDPGAGIRLGHASGAALTALYSVGPQDCLVYPAEDEAFNDLAPDAPLSLAAGFTWLAAPAVDHWIVILASGAGEPDPPPGPPPLQYETPADGAVVVMTGRDLALDPAAILASLTIRLPGLVNGAGPADGDVVRGMTTQAIMALSFVADPGAAVIGAPEFVAAGEAWALRWRALSASWFNWT